MNLCNFSLVLSIIFYICVNQNCMKLLKLFLLVGFFVGFADANAQNAVKIIDKSYRPQTAEERQKKGKVYNEEAMSNKQSAKNVAHKSTPVYTPNNYSIDERAYKYYTNDEISKMTVKEKKEINYLLNNSFEIIKMQGLGCPTLDKSKINVIDYSFYRKEDEKSEIIIDEKCNYRLILKSVNDVIKANDLITE